MVRKVNLLAIVLLLLAAIKSFGQSSTNNFEKQDTFALYLCEDSFFNSFKINLLLLKNNTYVFKSRNHEGFSQVDSGFYSFKKNKILLKSRNKTKPKGNFGYQQKKEYLFKNQRFIVKADEIILDSYKLIIRERVELIKVK